MNTTPTLAWGAATDYFNPNTITLRTSLPSLSAFWMVVVVCLEWHLMVYMDGWHFCMRTQENIWDTRYSKSVIKYTGLNRTMAYSIIGQLSQANTTAIQKCYSFQVPTTLVFILSEVVQSEVGWYAVCSANFLAEDRWLPWLLMTTYDYLWPFGGRSW